jgi:dTDP-4-dehydrorhamnose 3,5-epimerase
MLFHKSSLSGAYIVEPERLSDSRGFFARAWCRNEFEALGLTSTLAQCSISYNRVAGTLRGLHFQIAPHAEAKLVRCTMGSLYDVIVDLRPASSTFKQWFAVELSAENRLMTYVPEGCAHGFQTLTDHVEVFYQISEFYAPEAARGVRWNDPAFGIEWPNPSPILSAQDQQYPDFAQ